MWHRCQPTCAAKERLSRPLPGSLPDCVGIEMTVRVAVVNPVEMTMGCVLQKPSLADDGPHATANNPLSFQASRYAVIPTEAEESGEGR
jgi:hypothetical protein